LKVKNYKLFSDKRNLRRYIVEYIISLIEQFATALSMSQVAILVTPKLAY
jgi:hypothetical protein